MYDFLYMRKIQMDKYEHNYHYSDLQTHLGRLGMAKHTFEYDYF